MFRKISIISHSIKCEEQSMILVKTFLSRLKISYGKRLNIILIYHVVG